ncbi:Uncharacterized protein APZ42_002685 [Daphnia magna]|uniref:Uncharacterized protein n=1 Tax=Daphnia magna TaxID=35525 RepID=A0A164I3Y1_9CRUS|nr:Uncharacterized protein APZ42_002685 [Daphnia magna]
MGHAIISHSAAGNKRETKEKYLPRSLSRSFVFGFSLENANILLGLSLPFLADDLCVKLLKWKDLKNRLA